jgi:oxygen-dependent protoporphyrinogen oxidase
MTAAPRVVVVGGGISGLTAAYTVRKLRPDADVTLLEARARLGGNIVTERHEGFVIDGGPDSFVRSKPHATELCRELGLDSELISTREESRHVYVVRDGTLVPLPAGMALGVPTRIAPLLSTPLLSPAGKLRMLGDLVLPGHFQAPDGDESIASFVRRRFGTEAAEMRAASMLEMWRL